MARLSDAHRYPDNPAFELGFLFPVNDEPPPGNLRQTWNLRQRRQVLAEVDSGGGGYGGGNLRRVKPLVLDRYLLLEEVAEVVC